MLSMTITCTITIIMFSTICKSSTPVRRCSDDLPFPLTVQIKDCEALPCVVVRGTIVPMDVQFVGIKDQTNQIDAEVRATVLGLVIPYPLSNNSGYVCDNLLYGAYCPIYAGEDVTYRIDFPLESSVPEVSLKAEVKLVDKDMDVIACFVADLKVKKP